jgi:hypothetical protein
MFIFHNFTKIEKYSHKVCKYHIPLKFHIYKEDYQYTLLMHTIFLNKYQMVLEVIPSKSVYQVSYAKMGLVGEHPQPKVSWIWRIE